MVSQRPQWLCFLCTHSETLPIGGKAQYYAQTVGKLIHQELVEHLGQEGIVFKYDLNTEAFHLPRQNNGCASVLTVIVSSLTLTGYLL